MAGPHCMTMAPTFVSPSFNVGYGLVVPRSMTGAVGSDENDVRGRGYAGGNYLAFDNDPRSGALIMGDAATSFVTTRHLVDEGPLATRDPSSAEVTKA